MFTKSELSFLREHFTKPFPDDEHPKNKVLNLDDYLKGDKTEEISNVDKREE